MTQPVVDMDKIADKQGLTANCQHLKPLSVYSRMITSDQKASVHHFSNPFINFKIEIRNNCVKRKLDDSSIDECYETPAKKAVGPKAVSPHLGYFTDCCSPTMSQDSAIKIEIKQTVSPQLFSERVECGSSEPQRLGDNALADPHSFKSDTVLLNVAPAFDGDVDNILCLNPFGTSTAGRLSNVESGKSPSSNLFHNAAMVLGQELEIGDSQVEGEERKKGLNVKDIEDEKGYFSMSYIRDFKTGKDPSQSESPQPPQAPSSALLTTGEVEASEVEGWPERRGPTCHKRAALSVQYVSFTSGHSDPVFSGSTESNSPIEPLEGDVEEVWNIGLPIFESSMCHNVSVKLSDGSEQGRQALEEVQGGMMEPIQTSRATLDGEETTLDTSYETTLPLQIQVKSVVVVPHQHPFISKPSAGPLPKQTAEPTSHRPIEIRVSQNPAHVSSARSQRPVIFENELQLERDKKMYIHSVIRHLNEYPGVNQDAITELHSLMTHVAKTSTAGTQWQHPSDLTHRNYQRQFGNTMPTVALREWKAKNCATRKRFAKVPKIFQRSQSP